MNSKKTLFMTAVSAAALAVSAGAAFENVNTYTDGLFSDVAGDAWYADEVKSTYSLGLMNGVGGGLFDPEGSVTVAEAITMAARACAAQAGETIPVSDGEWYQAYVDYALSKGFLKADSFDDYERPAKRYEVAELFADAMPDGYFGKINDVDDIHDVPDSREYKDELLTLYRAGVVMGSDNYGTFNPEYSITRAEAAAIINRVAFPESRLEKKLLVISDDDAFYLCQNSGMDGEMTGINSGWELDNRGGMPRTSLMASYATTTDISTTAGTALIRDLNKTSTGRITLYSEISVASPNGFYIEFRNEAGESVYRAEVIDGVWNVLTDGGKYVPAYEIKNGTSQFKITAVADLDNGIGSLEINGEDCAEFVLPVSGDDANIYNFRYATTDESISSYRISYTAISSNYTLDEGFGKTTKGTVPKGWTADDGVGAVGELQREYLEIPGGKSASYSFDPIGGKPIAEFNFILPENETVSYTLKSTDKVAAEFTADESGFYLNGNKVYDGQYKNLWYRVRLELDTDTQTIFIRVNGRDRGTYDFAEAVTSVNNFAVSNFSETPAGFDNFKLFKYIDHEDYVPEPVVPEGADDYKIGMNVCSLWRNGTHYGWSCITPFDDPQPVLGYYDECNPETADWEIKYFVEHGIDFQAFCMFFYWEQPFNLAGTHLMDGFMNAKYSDMSEFCILLEAANGGTPSSVEDWKERWVPYIIENFIKHESYATVDNRPIFSVFGPTKISDSLGGDAKVKECFDYLEQEVIKLGFDGMVYLACGTSSARLQAMGFDGCHAYNWNVEGYQAQTNIDKITASGDRSEVYTVPTVSVGFNNVPWAGTRYPLMSEEDYRTATEWIRDEYLPAYAEQEWQKNFLWLSTLNEYGEGTYIMPTTDEKGFMYMDTVRETFTKESADDSLNTIPTAEQRYRINHLYPQYARILRAQGYYKSVPSEDSESLLTINMTDVSNDNLWSMKDIKKGDDGVTAVGSGSDPIFNIPAASYNFNVDGVTHLKLTAKIPAGEVCTIYYATGSDTGASEARTIKFTSESDELTEYTCSVLSLKNWSGKLNYIRVDPLEKKDVEFTVKSIELICDTSLVSNYAIFDGQDDFTFKFAPMKGEKGNILAAFDPTTAIDYRLNCFAEWNRDKKELALHFEKHDVVYTIGSDKYLLDGQEKSLGFTLGDLDGLPLIPINILCEDVGYKCKINSDNKLEIETSLKAYYDKLAESRHPGKWEFETAGDTEGWKSGLMTILVSDGSLVCDSRNDTWTLTDPTVTTSTFDAFSADDIAYLELRVRYNYEYNEAHDTQQIKMYFTTDVNTKLSEANTFAADLETDDTNGEWVTIRMAAPETFKGTVTSLRFDPFDAYGHIEVDYIRFLTAEEAEQ